MIENQHHILVYRLSSMGDVAMTVPVLTLLLQQHPNLKITVISSPKFEALFLKLPRTEFFPVDTGLKHKGLFGIFKLSVDLAKLKPDFIADLHCVLRSKILKFLLNFRLTVPIKTIDKGRKEKKKLCANKPDKKIYQLKTTFERYAEVFAALGFKIDLNAPMNNSSQQCKDESLKLLSEAENRTAIGIAPFARYDAKTYPEQQMKTVISQLLISKPNIQIYLFGGQNDIKKLSELKSLYTNKITIVANELNLEAELELISNLKLMLSMDSANMHLASMLAVPVVSLWGVTDPVLGFYGWRQDPKNAIYADRLKFPTLPASVNGSNVHPGTEKCMESIDPIEVVRKIIENL